MKYSLFAILSILLASACAPINKASSSQVNEKSSSQGSDSTSSLQETPKWNGEVKGNTFKLVGIVIENERLFLESLQSMKLSVSSIEEGKTAIEQLYFDSWGNMLMVFKEDNKCEMTYPGSKHGGEGITAISTYSQNKNVVLVTSHSIVYQDGTEQIDSNPSTTELYVVENGLKYSGSTSEDTAAGYYPFLEIQSKTL